MSVDGGGCIWDEEGRQGGGSEKSSVLPCPAS